MRFSKLIVTAVVVLNAIFTVAVFYVFLQVGSEPTALIAAWFAFTTGELWALASIQKRKMFFNNRNKGEKSNVENGGQGD